MKWTFMDYFTHNGNLPVDICVEMPLNSWIFGHAVSIVSVKSSSQKEKVKHCVCLSRISTGQVKMRPVDI